jgi:hypothetical protein
MVMFRTTREGERGAILVHVAFAVLALMAFSTFTIDYGVFWLSRRQAQNAADAGVMAGALQMIVTPDTTPTGLPTQVAHRLTQRNFVFGQVPSVTQGPPDITFPPCPPPYDPAETCIRVDVYRNQARNNPLPMFAGNFLGLVDQDVQAMATARLVGANYSDCNKPVAVMDQFDDKNGNGVFDAGDEYTAPSATGPGTGYSATQPPVGSYGTMLVLKSGPQAQLSPGWFHALDYGSGGDTYRDAWSGCVPGASHGIGDIVDEENGNMQGPTQQGVADLIAMDEEADWDGDEITGGCMAALTCVLSPRVVPIPLFDPAHWTATGADNQAEIRIVNIIGFFILDSSQIDNPPEGFDPQFDIAGILMNLPGQYSSTNGEVSAASSFLQTIVLVR